MNDVTRILMTVAVMSALILSGCGSLLPPLSPNCADLAAAALKERGEIVLWCKE